MYQARDKPQATQSTLICTQNRMFSLVLITILLSSCSQCLEEDYFWREFLGTVPGDAVVAGKTIDSQNVYIGQAYIKDTGLLVGQITPGVKEIYVAYGHEIEKADKYIKILCGPQENFYWMKANASELHLQLTDKHAVIGGHEDGNGYLNIGRIRQAGELKIGKVTPFWLEGAYLYFNDSGAETRLNSYEILLYKTPSTNIDPRIAEE